mgnify:CR=1 FL=1
MDKNAIKKYAVWARRELIARVSQRAAYYEITEEGCGDPMAEHVHGVLLSSDEIRQRQILIAQVGQKGYREVIEEAAYTWFNRFIALRFLEVNGYLPSHVRVFTDDSGAFKPQILAEAIHLELDGLDMQRVYQLKTDNDDDGLFKYLIITQCNALNPLLPKMFQKIGDETELLFPDNLLREGSVVEQLVTQIPEEDWKDQVQIIGWLYQYYNSEKKDEVFAALKKNVKITKENIPAVTQLFTPDWIVRYMVENSLGRLWINHLEGDQSMWHLDDGKPHSVDEHEPEIQFFKDQWRYYLDEAEQPEDRDDALWNPIWALKASYSDLRPQDIKFLDPCMGSGHILVYAFEVLMQIYESQGWSQRDAAQSILEHNLYGLDIDDRAAQLAYFAVMMKARQYDRRILTRGIRPNLYAIQESDRVNRIHLSYLGAGLTELERNDADNQIRGFLDSLKDAKDFGALVCTGDLNWPLLHRFVSGIDHDGQMSMDAVGLDETCAQLEYLLEVGETLARQYDVVVTNPPYMGSSGMNGKLSDFVKRNFPDSKGDLFACFIERGFQLVKPTGFNCMVTMQSWMFLSSFEKMREKILQSKTITTLMHMENMVMGIAFGTAVTCFRNCYIKGYRGTYNQIKLQDIEDGIPKEFPVQGNRFAQVSAENFSKIPGAPVSYWVSEAIVHSFEKGKPLKTFVDAKHGMTTGNVDFCLRFWHECDYCDIGFSFSSEDEFLASKYTWAPDHKGGAYRKWYGNNEYVVGYNSYYNLQMDTFPGHRHDNRNYYFKKGITWTDLTSGTLGARYSPPGFIFDVSGPTAFLLAGNLYIILGFMCSKVTAYFMDLMNSTMHYLVGQMNSIPILDMHNADSTIQEIVQKNISVSKYDWDSYETSWDFKRHPLI